MFLSLKTLCIAAMAATLLMGCSDPSPPLSALPRPVKVETIGAADASAPDTFVGTLRARQRSDLGFESPGRIAAVLVDVGDHVRSGQVLARLETGPLQWRLAKAEADRTAAAAALADRAMQLRQHELLAKEHMVSAAALESVVAHHQAARSQLQVAGAALAMAQRDLALAQIKAPFDGAIVARLGQPHSDIGAGQALLQIEAGNALEVITMLPDTVAAQLALGTRARAIGAPAAAPPASAPNAVRAVPLRLERLSSRNESGSLVQATFLLEGSATGLRSGSVVSVELPRARVDAITLPIAAIMAGVENHQASVFVLDAAKGTLVRRAIHTGSAVLPRGRIAVTSGLSAGELVVVAGTAFLSDGQPAIAHVAQTILQGSRP